MNVWVGIVLMIMEASLPGVVAQHAQEAAEPPPEIMHIDGGKNPELIPQWSAWGYAFRVIAGGPRELPSIVHHVVSSDERAMVLKEADAVQQIDKGCHERVLKLHSLLNKEKPAVIDGKLRPIIVECRRRTLDARDRVLQGLNPEGAAALIMFVESTKSSTSLSIRKSELARFLEPE